MQIKWRPFLPLQLVKTGMIVLYKSDGANINMSCRNRRVTIVHFGIRDEQTLIYLHGTEQVLPIQFVKTDMIAICKFFLRIGADINLCKENRTSPLDIAYERRHNITV